MSDDHSREHAGIPRPMPSHLAELYTALREWAEDHPCEPAEPPKPLILAAYWDTTDNEKDRRWREMQQWAERNGCAHLLADVTDAVADDPIVRRYGRDWRTRPFLREHETEDDTDES
jgi:hypothetical protein